MKVYLTHCNIPNNSGLLIQSNYSRIPVRTILCAVDSRGSPTKSDPLSCITVTQKHEGIKRGAGH